MPVKRIAVVDYGMGNLRSVSKALERLGGSVQVTDSPRRLLSAAAVVLPGVGHFGAAMRNLRRKRLDEAILSVLQNDRPFLGICLGLQLLFERSDEAPGTHGLGWLEGSVQSLARGKPSLKVPHMGWNRVRFSDGSSGYYYFVHTFAPFPRSRSCILGRTTYGRAFASAVQQGNVLACQFHPEKSQKTGLGFLRERFLRPHRLA